MDLSPGIAIILQAAIAAAVTIVLGYFSMKTRIAVETSSRRAQDSADSAQTQVSEVKNVLQNSNTAQDAKLDGLAKVAKDTHVLVNSNMGLQLQLTAAALRRLAEVTKDPEDIEAAELAVRALEEHNRRQAIVDASGKAK